MFECWQNAEAGSFTVPVEVLSSLPPSDAAAGRPGGLSVINTSFGESFSASGLDFGRATYADGFEGNISYR